jgi:hypothetical protein
MKTTDIFTKTSSKKINESVEKIFGTKLNLESYETGALEDMRNKLRTQIFNFKQSATFNETVENETYTKAQWILDAVNLELTAREESIQEGYMKGYQKYHCKDCGCQMHNCKPDCDCSHDSHDEKGSWWVDANGNGIPDVMESQTQGEEMEPQVNESATDQASAIVAAKTMVDKVGRWIEELASMENDQMLDLSDSIRDEMGLEASKQFVSTVAPAIESALENLKQARETLASGVRTLTGEESPTDMLGAEPEGETPDMAEPAGDDEMNTDPDPEAGADDVEADDFATAEPAAGGMEEPGRAQRESVDHSHSLLRTLAG